jgi:HEAT repeat protein
VKREVASLRAAESRRMVAFCTNCWRELSTSDARCPHCGAVLEHDARSFEQKLIGALRHPLPETRARICWVLGQKRGAWAVPHLIPMLEDIDLFVRLAALRGLGEIGDDAALAAVERSLSEESVLMRAAAKTALDQIRQRRSAEHNRMMAL